MQQQNRRIEPPNPLPHGPDKRRHVRHNPSAGPPIVSRRQARPPFTEHRVPNGRPAGRGTRNDVYATMAGPNTQVWIPCRPRPRRGNGHRLRAAQRRFVGRGPDTASPAMVLAIDRCRDPGAAKVATGAEDAYWRFVPCVPVSPPCLVRCHGLISLRDPKRH